MFILYMGGTEGPAGRWDRGGKESGVQHAGDCSFAGFDGAWVIIPYKTDPLAADYSSNGLPAGLPAIDKGGIINPYNWPG